MSEVLIIAAHPDDEVLGCGGAIAKHFAMGDTVNVVFLTDGESARENHNSSDIKYRREAALAALDILGVNGEIRFLNFPDNALDSVRLLDIVVALEDIILSFNTSIVYTHSSVDLNIDHQLVNRAVMTCFRPIRKKNPLAIYAFEIASSTEWAINNQFRPTHFVDIVDFLTAKTDAMLAYNSEMRTSPHPRSLDYIKSLAIVRGAQGGFLYAESFETLRTIG